MATVQEVRGQALSASSQFLVRVASNTPAALRCRRRQDYEARPDEDPGGEKFEIEIPAFSLVRLHESISQLANLRTGSEPCSIPAPFFMLSVSCRHPGGGDYAAGCRLWWAIRLAGICCLRRLPFGVTLLLTTMAPPSRLSVRQAFFLTTTSWLAMTFFAALPFAFANLELDFTDAFFEAMSGLTTTGSTVITSLDTTPSGILLWRAILQWLGGIGIIVMSIAILPMRNRRQPVV